MSSISTSNSDSSSTLGVNETINIISNILTEIIDDNSSLKEDNLLEYSIFDCKVKPKITIKKYLERILKHTGIENSTLICSFILLDRLVACSQIALTSKNIHQILLSSITIALKVNEDHIYTDNFYAKIGGISLSELNELEAELLQITDYKVSIDEKTFNLYQLFIQIYEKIF